MHGDYRLDNVLIDDTGRLTAVLDWEMSTLGDPLTDLGLLVMYSEQHDMPPGLPATTAYAAPGHPDPRELVERYALRSRRDVSAVDWYTAFACFKLAVILEGIHYRWTLGHTLGAGLTVSARSSRPSSTAVCAHSGPRPPERARGPTYPRRG